MNGMYVPRKTVSNVHQRFVSIKAKHQNLNFIDNRSSSISQKKAIDILANKPVIQKYQSLQFGGVKPSKSQPNPLLEGRRYWIVAPSTFTPGQGYLNSSNAKYKKSSAGLEIHASLNNPLPIADKSEALRTYARLQEPRLNDKSVNLSNWTTNRCYVGDWHISIKNGAANVGGWFGMSGGPIAGLPAYTDNGHAATANDTAFANQILTNMNNNII